MSADRVVLRVVRGEPDAEELAALVAVVAGMAGGGAVPGPVAARSEWGNPARSVRGALRPGVGGWRASGLPR
ncbi:acyl-CoA carboxylase subunit epsilon [Umezawaea sp.]|uniref:acyl-CoA carboxylase subunit epsilon n=1 Tax=Umezawaea sp. TaxID=1955258 RepID=UPI002ED66E4B